MGELKSGAHLFPPKILKNVFFFNVQALLGKKKMCQICPGQSFQP